MLNKKIKRISIISNIVLSIILIMVFTISFYPENIDETNADTMASAIYTGNENKNNVSIMINVYENADIVEKMVDILCERQVKATFFIGGCWADDNKKTLEKIVDSENEIGSHGYFHKDHKKLNYEQNKQEIVFSKKLIKAMVGKDISLFAPPSGSFSSVTLKACEDLNMKVIMWSKDTIDWRDNDISLIFNRATKNPKNGDMILMHPKTHTLEILPQIIDFYKENGYNIVTVSENINGE